MRRIIKTIIPLILIISLSVFQDSSCTFNVKNGDYFEYIISQAEFSATVGSNTLSSTGIKMNENNVPIGSVLSINVTYVIGNTVYFWMSAHGNRLSGVARPNLEEGNMWASVLYIIGVLDLLTNNWEYNINYFENGFNLYYTQTFIPFFEAEQETWDFIDNFITELESYYTTTKTDQADYTLFYLNSEENDIFIGEWLVLFNDNRQNELFNASLTATSHYKSAMQKSTGILLGSRYEGSCTGELDGLPIDIAFKLLFQEINYDMPDFEYDSTGGLSSNNWIITTSSVTFVTIIITLSIKIKSKKKNF
ncbi:MAG TPA: choice-of-anchor S family protein [candidate division Zixibacteria bacterium]|nr:choice-of-anchor S family protein [candidate division Zixibacteria bacterium]